MYVSFGKFCHISDTPRWLKIFKFHHTLYVTSLSMNDHYITTNHFFRRRLTSKGRYSTAQMQCCLARVQVILKIAN